jgi:hypothetical protein
MCDTLSGHTFDQEGANLHLHLRLQLLVAGNQLLANTQWRSLSTIVTIDPKDGRASRLSPRDGAAWTLLDNNNGERPHAAWGPAQPPAP